MTLSRGSETVLSTEAGLVLHALVDETVQRVIGLVMGLPLGDVKRAVDEIGAQDARRKKIGAL